MHAYAVVSTTPRLRLIMSQDQDSRLTPTDPAPALDRNTQPPEQIAETAAAEYIKGALSAAKTGVSSETMRELAEHELIGLYRTAIGMHESLLGTSGLLEQTRQRTVEDLTRVVDRGFDRVWERVGPRLSQQDRKIDELKAEVSTLRGQLQEALARVDELERRLDDNDAASTRAPHTPT